MAREVSERSFELRVCGSETFASRRRLILVRCQFFSGILNETMGEHHTTRAQTHSIHCFTHTHKHARTHTPVCLSDPYLCQDQWPYLASPYLCHSALLCSFWLPQPGPQRCCAKSHRPRPVRVTAVPASHPAAHRTHRSKPRLGLPVPRLHKEDTVRTRPGSAVIGIL